MGGSVIGEGGGREGEEREGRRDGGRGMGEGGGWGQGGQPTSIWLRLLLMVNGKLPRRARHF